MWQFWNIAVVFTPNITTNHGITYTNRTHPAKQDFIALLPGIYQSSSITLESVPRLQSPQLFLKKTKKDYYKSVAFKK